MATLNIVFMGTPTFATTALRELVADQNGRYDVKLVLTRPDAVSVRGKTLVPSPVRRCAEELGIPVETPRSFRSRIPDLTQPSSCRDELLARIAATDPDFIVVAAYGMILPQEVLDLPRYGCINIHGSLLPRWRGAAPIQRALLAGDAEAGVCIMRMEAGLDTGPFCAVASTPTGEKNTETLTAELAQLGANLLLEALPRIAAGTTIWASQDETLVTYADKVEKSELALDPSLSALINVRRVRASSSQIPARCTICGKSVTVLKAQTIGEDKVADKGTVPLSSFYEKEDRGTVPLSATLSASPLAVSAGTVPYPVFYENKRLMLATADGFFEVTSLKPDGKKIMPATAFAAGVKELQKGSQSPALWQSIERSSR